MTLKLITLAQQKPGWFILFKVKVANTPPVKKGVKKNFFIHQSGYLLALSVEVPISCPLWSELEEGICRYPAEAPCTGGVPRFKTNKLFGVYHLR